MYIRPHLDYGNVIYHRGLTSWIWLNAFSIKRHLSSLGVCRVLAGKGCMKTWVGNPCPTDGGTADWRYFTKSRRVSPPPPPPLGHIPKRNEISMVLRNRCDYVPLSRTDRCENSFFPYTIKAWKNLDEEAKPKPSVQSFKTYITKTYIRTPGHSFFGISDKHGICLLIKSINLNFFIRTVRVLDF